MRSVEIFSGAGGLNLGVMSAGFNPLAVIELNSDACVTIRANHAPIKNGPFPLFETDARLFDYTTIDGEVDLLAAGPPCQPFSLAGKHEGSTDGRNMFPEVFRAVRTLRPKAILIENVRGIGRLSFSKYLKYILLQLEFPDRVKLPGEKWRTHLSRLESKRPTEKAELSYKLDHKFLNAADFGVPQLRERLFIVGFRRDIEVSWSFPKPTHSFEALLWDQWISGRYWGRHGLKRSWRTNVPDDIRPKLKALKAAGKPKTLPWKTVRDALVKLPAPFRTKGEATPANHLHIPGARSYTGHTGSAYDFPSKTLKAGSHGVPGGENMLIQKNGKVRYFTMRECAKLQSFPDDYVFHGTWSSITRQIGNAVPVLLGQAMATSVAAALP